MRRRTIRRGMTMLEAVLAIAVLGVIGAVTLPVIGAAADGYSSASQVRGACGRTTFALERCLRLLREAPGSTELGTLHIAEASPNRIVFDDGRGLTLTDRTLWMIDESGAESPLLRAVDNFEITYLADDGVTLTLDDPDATQRFFVSLTSDGFTLRGVALPRIRAVPPEEGT